MDSWRRSGSRTLISRKKNIDLVCSVLSFLKLDFELSVPQVFLDDCRRSLRICAAVCRQRHVSFASITIIPLLLSAFVCCLLLFDDLFLLFFCFVACCFVLCSAACWTVLFVVLWCFLLWSRLYFQLSKFCFRFFLEAWDLKLCSTTSSTTTTIITTTIVHLILFLLLQILGFVSANSASFSTSIWFPLHFDAATRLRFCASMLQLVLLCLLLLLHLLTVTTNTPTCYHAYALRSPDFMKLHAWNVHHPHHMTPLTLEHQPFLCLSLVARCDVRGVCRGFSFSALQDHVVAACLTCVDDGIVVACLAPSVFSVATGTADALFCPYVLRLPCVTEVYAWDPEQIKQCRGSVFVEVMATSHPPAVCWCVEPAVCCWLASSMRRMLGTQRYGSPIWAWEKTAAQARHGAPVAESTLWRTWFGLMFEWLLASCKRTGCARGSFPSWVFPRENTQSLSLCIDREGGGCSIERSLTASRRRTPASSRSTGATRGMTRFREVTNSRHKSTGGHKDPNVIRAGVRKHHEEFYGDVSGHRLDFDWRNFNGLNEVYDQVLVEECCVETKWVDIWVGVQIHLFSIELSWMVRPGTLPSCPEAVSWAYHRNDTAYVVHGVSRRMEKLTQCLVSEGNHQDGRHYFFTRRSLNGNKSGWTKTLLDAQARWGQPHEEWSCKTRALWSCGAYKKCCAVIPITRFLYSSWGENGRHGQGMMEYRVQMELNNESGASTANRIAFRRRLELQKVPGNRKLLDEPTKHIYANRLKMQKEEVRCEVLARKHCHCCSARCEGWGGSLRNHYSSFHFQQCLSRRQSCPRVGKEWEMMRLCNETDLVSETSRLDAQIEGLSEQGAATAKIEFERSKDREEGEARSRLLICRVRTSRFQKCWGRARRCSYRQHEWLLEPKMFAKV